MSGRPDPRIPWATIRRRYWLCLPNRAIAREFGITEGAIRRRAKRERWERLPRSLGFLHPNNRDRRICTHPDGLTRRRECPICHAYAPMAPLLVT